MSSNVSLPVFATGIAGWEIVTPAAAEVGAKAGSLKIGVARSPYTRAITLAFIQAQFRDHFGAQIVDDTPELMACLDDGGSIVAAWGLRRVADGLFSQRYLDSDLLSCLRTRIGSWPAPTEVVELAHLCVGSPKVLRELVPLLAAALVQMDFQYLVCTATGCLIRFFRRRGLVPMVLAQAQLDLLPEADRSRWGAYYDHGPMVIAGRIDSALRAFQPEVA